MISDLKGSELELSLQLSAVESSMNSQGADQEQDQDQDRSFSTSTEDSTFLRPREMRPTTLNSRNDLIDNSEREAEAAESDDELDQPGTLPVRPQRVFFERELPYAYPINIETRPRRQRRIHHQQQPLQEESNGTSLTDPVSNLSTDEPSQQESVTNTNTKRINMIDEESNTSINGIPFPIGVDSENPDMFGSRTRRFLFLTSILFFLISAVSSSFFIRSNDSSSDSSVLTGKSESNNSEATVTVTTQPESHNTTNEMNFSNQSHEDVHNTLNNDNNNTDATDVTPPFQCFTETMAIQTLEWQAYERGDDPSIPRTYHFCENSYLHIFGFDREFFKFIYSVGNTHPLILFRSNIHIICDGNCTFYGGVSHLILNHRPLLINYDVSESVENITIEGFRFAGSEYGINVVMRASKSGLTIKNCVFEDNHNMIGTIKMATEHTISSSLKVQSSVFENNILERNPTKTFDNKQNKWVDRLPIIGIIHAFPNPSTILDATISNSRFQNNTFLMPQYHDDEHEIHLNTTGAIINLPTSTANSASISVTNTCFIENKHHCSLILFGQEQEKEQENQLHLHKDLYSTNYFSGNEDMVSSNLPSSCILGYQRTIFEDGVLMNATFHHEDCGLYLKKNESIVSFDEAICLI